MDFINFKGAVISIFSIEIVDMTIVLCDDLRQVDFHTSFIPI